MRIFLITLMATAMSLAGAEDDVKNAEQAWADAITKNDFAPHYLHSTGLGDSKAAYIESMKSGKQNYISVKYGKMPKHLAFTHVFAKKGGKWQLVSHQSLRLAN